MYFNLLLPSGPILVSWFVASGQIKLVTNAVVEHNDVQTFSFGFRH